MATFAYVGRTAQGVTRKGEVAAKTKEEAAAQLRQQRIAVSSLQEKKGGGRFGFGGGPNVTDRDVVIFTRQFGTMINAGLPLIQCLEILSTQSENKAFGKIIGEIKLDVEGGSTFADAIRKKPKAFDELYANMIHAGEIGGLLDTVLVRLAVHMEKAMKLKAQIKSAMVYPAAILGVSVIVISVLMVWVIPIFAKMFLEMSGGKAGLPGPTQLVIDASDFMQANILYIAVAGAAGVSGVKKYYATPKGRYNMDKLALKIPVMGDLIRKAAVAKFTRTLGTLITSGVPILEGLSITAKTSGNKVVEEVIVGARSSISEGKTVAEPLSKSDVFPKMVIHMISVGESTGALDAMLSKIADFYDEEVDAAVASLTALLEPMMMVFLGTVIGFIVIAMYLPIFKMASVVG
ncbi:MAG: type II secretion system F family protein [Nitrospirota bacterium]|nr:type II secretion system F family protein [Nitrospirota bacterium]